MSDTLKPIEEMSDEELLEMGQVPGDEDFQLEDSNSPSDTLEDDLMQVKSPLSGSEEESEADGKEEHQQTEETDSEETGEDRDNEVEGGEADTEQNRSVDQSESSDEFVTPSDNQENKQEESDKKNDSSESIDSGSESKLTSETFDALQAKANAYDQVFAPFKANGREIQVKTPEEVLQLMQMGANYTKKLQALQPHLKLVRMLENHNLANESKISFLIDLDKKNPDAIKKLIKDANIDPMDIDPEQGSDYRQGDYSVSDQQMKFDSVLQDVADIGSGRKVLQTLRQGWDGQSKQMIYEEPSILRTLTTHMESGIFDQIANEVETQKTLGNIGPEVPLLKAYHQVGRIMHDNGLLKDAQGNPLPTNQQSTQQQPATYDSNAQGQAERQVLATRTRTKPKPAQDKHAAAARAAAPVNSAPKTPPQDFNPLAMSDEEIIKMSSTGMAMKL